MNPHNHNIREIRQDDLEQIKEIYSNAFPEEDLLQLVHELHHDKTNVFSFIAEEPDNIIGHISFSTCHVREHANKLALLGPMAVSPKKQKQGIGSRLIRHGLKFLSENGFDKVVVLGDPNYYGRFGFLKEQAISPAYMIPEEWHSAWQSIAFSGAIANCAGQLLVPKAWQHPQLWSD